VRGTTAKVEATIAVYPVSITGTRSSEMPRFQAYESPTSRALDDSFG
jgi:hypothetical protein